MSSRATLILVHWNQPDACAESVAGFVSSPLIDDIIVVDNGSTEPNRRRLGEVLSPSVSIIDVGFNSGFGPAANRGWEAWLADSSGTEWSIVAPHDAIPAGDTVALMLAAAESHPSAGLLSADVGDGFRPFVDHVFGPILRPAEGTVGFESVDYPHGTLMMASRTCLDSIGLFDERFFAYCEEADLGLRAKAAGFDVGLIRGAMVTNPTVSTQSAAVEYLMQRNTVLLVATHFGRRKAAMRFVLMIAQLIRGLTSSQHRTPYWSARARRQAIADVLHQRWGPPPVALIEGR